MMTMYVENAGLLLILLLLLLSTLHHKCSGHEYLHQLVGASQFADALDDHQERL